MRVNARLACECVCSRVFSFCAKADASRNWKRRCSLILHCLLFHNKDYYESGPSCGVWVNVEESYEERPHIIWQVIRTPKNLFIISFASQDCRAQIKNNNTLPSPASHLHSDAAVHECGCHRYKVRVALANGWKIERDKKRGAWGRGWTIFTYIVHKVSCAQKHMHIENIRKYNI